MNKQFLTQYVQLQCWQLMALLLFTAPVFSQWTASNHGPYGGNVQDIAIGSAPSYTLYALPGANQSLFRVPSMLLTSNNGGQSWTQKIIRVLVIHRIFLVIFISYWFPLHRIKYYLLYPVRALKKARMVGNPGR